MDPRTTTQRDNFNEPKSPWGDLLITEIIDVNRQTINGLHAPPAELLIAEMLFSRSPVEHDTIHAAIDEDRQRRGTSRLPEDHGNVVRCAVRRIRKLLNGSGYSIKGIYGWGFEVVALESEHN